MQNKIIEIENKPLPGDKYRYVIKGTNILHCEDGPAVEIQFDEGENLNYIRWYINGQLHREDGPAMIVNDTKFYFLNDRLIRVIND